MLHKQRPDELSEGGILVGEQGRDPADPDALFDRVVALVNQPLQDGRRRRGLEGAPVAA